MCPESEQEAGGGGAEMPDSSSPVMHPQPETPVRGLDTHREQIQLLGRLCRLLGSEASPSGQSLAPPSLASVTTD